MTHKNVRVRNLTFVVHCLPSDLIHLFKGSVNLFVIGRTQLITLIYSDYRALVKQLDDLSCHWTRRDSF